MEKMMRIRKTGIAVAAFILMIVAVNIYLFRGNVLNGMEYDEVFRINNLIPLFNSNAFPYDQSIFSLEIGGIKIPLMYKEYISSASLLPWFPAFLFSDHLAAIRTLYMVYTVASEIILYCVLRRKNRFVAAVSVGLLAVCPLIFPYIRYGWAQVYYGVFLAFSCLSAGRYRKTGKIRYLFLCAFSTALMVNISFYSLWIVGGLLAATVLLFPRETIRGIPGLKGVSAILGGAVAGCFNHISYNVCCGFPALTTIFNYAFHLEKYNEKAIDAKITSSLLDSFAVKLKSYVSCIGRYWVLYLALLLFVIAIYVAVAVRMTGKGTFRKNRAFFVPAVASLITFVLILFSPNSEGSHHITYIVIILCVTIGIAIWSMHIEFGVKKPYVSALGIILIVLCFLQCGSSVSKNIESKGKDIFTEKIFDLVDYAGEEPAISNDSLCFAEWGFSAQFYFLNDGETDIHDITFGIQNASEEERQASIEEFLTNSTSDTLYVPVYYLESDIADYYAPREILDEEMPAFSEPVQLFIRFMKENRGRVNVHKWFPDNDGNGILLMRIDRVDRVRSSISFLSEYNHDDAAVSFHKQDDYRYTRGIYECEQDGTRWVKKQSQVILRHGNEKYVSIQFWIPEAEKRKEDSVLEIEINGVPKHTEEIKDSQEHRILVPVEGCFPENRSDIMDIRMYLTSTLEALPDERELAFCIEAIEPE